MIMQLSVGAGLILATVIVHAFALDFIISNFRTWAWKIKATYKNKGMPIIMSVTVLGVFTAHVIQIWIWALFYLVTGELETLEAALYFSTVTFTTVGYGDVTLSGVWRLLSSLESANGMLLFGWSTAFIFEVMRLAWTPEASTDSQPEKASTA
jgi:hypothetical protein